MNEEEITSILEDMLEKAGKLYEEEFYTLVEDKHMWAVRGLLDLYKQEKEKNIKLEKEIRELIKSYEHDMKLCNNDDMFEAVESDMYEYGIDRFKKLLGE